MHFRYRGFVVFQDMINSIGMWCVRKDEDFSRVLYFNSFSDAMDYIVGYMEKQSKSCSRAQTSILIAILIFLIVLIYTS